jgi:cobalt-zinc-cadmium efflux system outer membrane protein
MSGRKAANARHCDRRAFFSDPNRRRANFFARPYCVCDGGGVPVSRPFIAALAAGALTISVQSLAFAQDAGPLTREVAVARAMGDHPSLAAANEATRAADALARQSGLRPNPTLDLQLEDFGGGGPLNGVSGAQATYTLSQKIELGGDRKARVNVASRQAGAARLRADLSALDLREAVELAFVEAQGAQALVDVATARLAVARDFATAVDRRVRAARDPEAARARVAARLAETESDSATAAARAEAAKAALASYWGGAGDFAVESETFFATPERATDSTPAPDLALAEAERDSAAALVDVERAKRTPDPELRGGFRQLREIDESAFIVGVSVPLPVWNRNSGAIAAANAEKRRAELAVAARERELARETAFLSAQSAAARKEVDAYKTRILPASERALRETSRAYGLGGLSYIEVLDAQSALTEARTREIAALLSFHRADIRLARLRGAAGANPFRETDQ